jgi:hypothetical protein
VVLYTDKEEDTKMPRKGHTEEQILQALRQAEGGRRGEGRGDLPEVGDKRTDLLYIRREIAEQSAQRGHARQNPQLSSGTVLRGGSIPGEASFWMD